MEPWETRTELEDIKSELEQPKVPESSQHSVDWMLQILDEFPKLLHPPQGREEFRGPGGPGGVGRQDGPGFRGDHQRPPGRPGDRRGP